eukprot:6136444-Heterocapsa_arctica.AAC.1
MLRTRPAASWEGMTLAAVFSSYCASATACAAGEGLGGPAKGENRQRYRRGLNSRPEPRLRSLRY